MRVLGTTRQLSITYHPQMNSQTERINQKIEMFLQHYVNYQQDSWTFSEQLAAAEFQYNDKRHVVMGRTPFKLNFGKHPWKDDLVVQSEILRVEKFLAGLQKSWEQTTKAIEEAQKNIKRQFNKKR